MVTAARSYLADRIGETRRATPPSRGVTPKSHRARLHPTRQSLVAWPRRAAGEMGKRPSIGTPVTEEGGRTGVTLSFAGFRPPQPLPRPAACDAFLQVCGEDRARVLRRAPPSTAELLGATQSKARESEKSTGKDRAAPAHLTHLTHRAPREQETLPAEPGSRANALLPTRQRPAEPESRSAGHQASATVALQDVSRREASGPTADSASLCCRDRVRSLAGRGEGGSPRSPRRGPRFPQRPGGWAWPRADCVPAHVSADG